MPLLRYVTAITALLGIAVSAHADTYPSKPIRLIVPFPPGGTVDVTARAIAPTLSEVLGQTVVIDNRGGADGAIGAQAVAKSAPDGYTLLMGSNSSLTVSAALRSSLPFDPLRDFSPVSLVGSTPFALVVHTSVPVQSIAELISLGKSQPDKLTMAAGGVGHLVGELFQSMTGAKFLHVPFQGVGPASVALMGGQVDLMFEQLASAIPSTQSGKTRALAVTSAQRVTQLPGIPTAIESGVDGYVVESITGILAPAGTPLDVVARLNAALNKTLQSPAIRERFATIALRPTPSSPEEFADYLAQDLARWQKVVKDAGIPRQ
ncbi:MAG: tripartite tricarboxylate transporter substrate binding protein [Pigmentiphaga sp.]|uniref:Bug family tripartite tricarboxylate transporter substrate binding protein n=1 Tax=Pigmentiphaga sp. TaxID=1977564 RepID=UPI00299FBBAA|nr:tripartite tricarboxylate transporter substrate binding protein [Pigmentiphaga sp.]MDX3904360.1 tripartite tricarboxylate transporter substrate binding protein [Pigmentiphaga sp.]